MCLYDINTAANFCILTSLEGRDPVAAARPQPLEQVRGIPFVFFVHLYQIAIAEIDGMRVEFFALEQNEISKKVIARVKTMCCFESPRIIDLSPRPILR